MEHDCGGRITPPFRKFDKGALVIAAPGRSVEASRQILLHVGSALSGGGEVIILNNGKRRKGRPYTVFDVPYLGLVARKELRLERLERKARYPLLFEPFKSLRLLLGISRGNYVQRTCPDEEIRRYCERKSFRLTYMESS